MTTPAFAVTAFEVRVPRTAPNGIETYKALSRKYHVREAAEQFCALVKATEPKAYVAEVLGPYEADSQTRVRKGK